jgi:hypothetical protein
MKLERACFRGTCVSSNAVNATESLTTATHRAIEIALSPSPSEGTHELLPVMRELCATARRDGTRAEELIILFKKVWSDCPEVRTLPRESSTRLFDEVVTLCIKEYYGTPR